jgi:hypothetical protein
LLLLQSILGNRFGQNSRKNPNFENFNCATMTLYGFKYLKIRGFCPQYTDQFEWLVGFEDNNSSVNILAEIEV